MIDIKRRTELYIVDKLQAAIPAEKFVPYTGGSLTTDAEDIEPPFSVVAVIDATRTMATESTWICEGSVQVITHRKEATATQHSTLARAVYAALSNIPSYADSEYSFHGIDIVGMTPAEDEDAQAHADVIRFTAGAGG